MAVLSPRRRIPPKLSWSRQKNGTEPGGENVFPKTPVCVEAGEETNCQVLVNGCLGCRMTFGGQFLRQLPHRLVFQGSFRQDVFATRLSAVFLPRLDQLQRDSAVR